MEMNLETIRELVALATENNLAELTVEQEAGLVTIKTAQGAVVPVVTQIPAQAAAAAQPQGAPVQPAAAAEKPAEAAQPAAASAANLYKVTSPMVGTYYGAPSPESPPFVETGARISAGQTLCIIEAMKLMNELESEVSGIVRRVLVENGKPVEFGQVLMEIEVQS